VEAGFLNTAIMKSINNLCAFVLLIVLLVHFSCKKDLSCENCVINHPPIANAGTDQKITLPKDSILLDGSASTDPDGTIVSYKWTKISGPASSTIAQVDSSKILVKNLVMGVYKFELSVTDNGALLAKDTVLVIVDDPAVNQPPVANAAMDQTIILPTDTVLLNGTLSFDPDGTITSYKWTKISGPTSPNILKPDSSKTTVKALTTGVYQFELKVTDNGGLSAKDTMQVTVSSSSINLLPVAKAGNDTLVNYDLQACNVNTITLNGSVSYDPDGNIVSFLWSQLPVSSGLFLPPANILNPSSAITQISGLLPGAYSFTLKVTDNNFATDLDTIVVNVVGTNRPLINSQLIPIGTLSFPRAGLKSASDGNKILFAGGYDNDENEFTWVDIYDISTQAWSIAKSHWQSFGMAAGHASNKILFAGGQGRWEQFSITTSIVDIYDASLNAWSSAHLSVNRSHMGAATLDNKIFFAGGLRWPDGQIIHFPNSFVATNTVDIFNNTTGAWSTASLTEPRYGLSANTAGNKIYFAGGGGNYPSTLSKTIDIFDASTNSWSTSQLQEAKRDHAAISFNNKIYWAGGVTTSASGNQVPSSLVEIRDVVTGAISLSCLFQPNASFKAVVKDNKIVFFTGQGTVKNKFDIYNTVTNTWSVGVLPVSLEDATIISVNNTIYIAGGYVNGTESNQVWKLEF
jgi:hypothetical protein